MLQLAGASWSVRRYCNRNPALSSLDCTSLQLWTLVLDKLNMADGCVMTTCCGYVAKSSCLHFRLFIFGLQWSHYPSVVCFSHICLAMSIFDVRCWKNETTNQSCKARRWSDRKPLKRMLRIRMHVARTRVADHSNMQRHKVASSKV
jgi:hypothetical protein